jgi:hypothetical protein
LETLIIIHLLALVWYRWQKSQSLVPAMWHGDKSLPYLVTPSMDDLRSRVLAFVLLLVSASAVFAIISMGN